MVATRCTSGTTAFEQFWFQQQPTQVEALDGVLLHHAHRRRREITPNIAQPTGDIRRRTAQAAFAVSGEHGTVVELAERLIHHQVVTAERAAKPLRIAALVAGRWGAQDQAPTPLAFVIEW